jgi:hypothetical protein
MSHSFGRTWPARRILLGAPLIVCVALAPLLAPHVAARSRPVDVTSATVAYHLTALFTSGPTAGNILEGGISGTLDSTGVLTATLTATTGTTATVTGAVSDTVAGAILTVQGAAAHLTLSGRATGAGGDLGGTITQNGNGPLGSWLLTPETVTHSYAFVGRVDRGNHRGLDLGGTLAVNGTSETSGRFDGSLTLDDGTVFVAEGRLGYGNMQVVIHVPGAGVVMGAATPSLKLTLAGAPFTLFSGSFVGPVAGDSGRWSAGQSS